MPSSRILLLALLCAPAAWAGQPWEASETDWLAQSESARKLAEQQLAGNRAELKQCQTHNAGLYDLGREMMQKYHDKSCQDALAQAEPFSGLKKVEVEQLMETWRDQLDRDRLGRGKPAVIDQP